MMSDCVVLEMAMNRMSMFMDGKSLMSLDKAAAEAVRCGVTPGTISVVASVFGGAAKNLKASRANRIKAIMTGGFVTRLKMEAEGVMRQKELGA